jgi:dTDP-4-dehydrorhamnose 3,5-epimerase
MALASDSAALEAGELQPLEGVTRRDLRVFADERGSMREIWRDSWGYPVAPGIRFVQGNVSHSQAGVLRGLHFHRRQDDFWVLLSGRAVVALVDLRSATPGSLQAGTRPPVMLFEMRPDSTVYIPTGIAHGFLALEPLTLMYLVSNEYDGTDELGFAWNDPDAAIDWPGSAPILSPRDQSNPSLRELLETLEAPE